MIPIVTCVGFSLFFFCQIDRRARIAHVLNLKSCVRRLSKSTLSFRFSLVGGMFNTICGSWSSVQEWSTLLVQLIVRGVVDLTNNSDLFTLLLDMLAILIHSALIQDREGNLSCLLPVKVTEWTHFESC